MSQNELQINKKSMLSMAGNDFPKKPHNFNLECVRDFEFIREKYGHNFDEFIERILSRFENLTSKPEVKEHIKSRLEKVKELIENRNKILALREFTQTFPTCMPYRIPEERPELRRRYERQIRFKAREEMKLFTKQVNMADLLSKIRK